MIKIDIDFDGDLDFVAVNEGINILIIPDLAPEEQELIIIVTKVLMEMMEMVGILGGKGEILNCTIVSNTPNGIEKFNCNTINSIIYFNTSAQIEGMITITYSNIEGSYTGDNIIDSDPLFVDISKDDFHMLNNSPCINAGSNITLNDSNTDKDGNFRLSNFDIGAYENISVQSNYYKSDNFQHIAAGYFHSLALKEDGTLCSWGYNGNGELGNGNDLEQQSPVKVKNLNNIINMVAGHHHNLALKNDGTSRMAFIRCLK